MDKYFEGLTASEWAEHEKVEGELNKLLREGFTERAAMAFTTTAIAIRKIMPSATIEGILDAALLSGLEKLLGTMRGETEPARTKAAKRKTKRSGVRLVT